MTNPRIRYLVYEDLGAVLAIEAASYVEGWGEGDFLRILRQKDCFGVVFRSTPDGAILGFMLYQIYRKEAIALLNLAITPEQRRRGFGRQMIDYLKDKTDKAPLLTSTICESNLVAQLFLRAQTMICFETIRDQKERICTSSSGETRLPCRSLRTSAALERSNDGC